MSDKENAEKGASNVAIITAQTTQNTRPLSVRRGKESPPVGLDIKQKKPVSAPDPLALKEIAAAEAGQSDISDDELVS